MKIKEKRNGFSYNLDVMALAENYNHTIFKWLKKNTGAGDTILDFGAGSGEFCNRFEGYDISAVEPDETFHPFINCKKYETIDEIEHKFDVIYSLNVLEHIENDSLIVSKFYDYLNPWGRVKILVPARKELFSRMDIEVFHFRRYEREGLIDLFVSNGFEVNYCRYFDSLGYLATQIYKRLDRGEGEDLKAEHLLLYDRLVFPVSSLIDKVFQGKIVGKNLLLEAAKVSS